MDTYTEHGNGIWSFVLILTGILLCVTGIGVPIGVLFLAIGALTFGTTERMKDVTTKQVAQGDVAGATGTWAITVVILMVLMAVLVIGIFGLT